MDTLIFHSQFSIWIRYVYGFFKLSTYFRHGIPVSCNHSRGTASWVLKTACHPFWNRYFIGNLFLRLCEQSIPQKSVWPCGTEYRAGSRTVQKQEVQDTHWAIPHNFRKTPRQRDRSLRKKPLLSLRGVAPYNALSAGTESAYFLRSDKMGGKAVICLVLVFLWILKNRTIVLFCWHKQWYGVKLI